MGPPPWPVPSEQTEGLGQRISWAQVSGASQLTAHLQEVWQSTPPVHAPEDWQSTEQGPAPQVIWPPQANLPQVMVQLSWGGQVIAPPHWLLPQSMTQGQPSGQVQALEQAEELSSQNPPTQLLTHAEGQLLLSGEVV